MFAAHIATPANPLAAVSGAFCAQVYDDEYDTASPGSPDPMQAFMTFVDSFRPTAKDVGTKEDR